MKTYMGIDWGSYGIEFPHCLAPWKAAFVQADGFVRPCCIYPPVMGNTNEKRLELIWNDEPYRQLRLAMAGKAQLPDICASCHDSMRHLDIEWYLKHAIEEKIAQNKCLRSIEELLVVLVMKGYMVLSAIYLMSLVYRKQGEYRRELYCLLSCQSGIPQAEMRIRELRGQPELRTTGQAAIVTVDIVLLSRLKTRLSEISMELEQLLGHEYSSVDTYIEDIQAISSQPLGRRRLKKVLSEYAMYNDMALLEKSIRSEAQRMRVGALLANAFSIIAKRFWWMRSIIFLALSHAQSFLLSLPNRAFLLFDRIRKIIRG